MKAIRAEKPVVETREPNPIPAEAVRESVLINLAMAYLSVSKQLERRTQCSQTRGYILSTLRGGAALNQNQIATLLGFDRTVVHRSIKTMVCEGLVAERPAGVGRALMVSLTARGTKYREYLIGERHAADEKVQAMLKPREKAMLIRLLKIVAEVEL